MKYSKEDTGYVDPLIEDTGRPCVVCRYFRATIAACALVEGLISPGASCTRFEPFGITDVISMMEE